MRLLLALLLTSAALAQVPEVGDTIELTAPALIESTEGGEFVTRALLPGERRVVLERATEDGREQVRLEGGWCYCDEMRWRVVGKPVKRPKPQRMRHAAGSVSPPVRARVGAIQAPVAPTRAAKRQPKPGNKMVNDIEYQPGRGGGPGGSWIPINWDSAEEPPGGPPVLGLVWTPPVPGVRRGTWRKR